MRINFGVKDPYLNTGVAQRFHELFPTPDLFLIADANHFVQIDVPEKDETR
jgi:pimeloyl-ACP methyl ester carboxylesterase